MRESAYGQSYLGSCIFIDFLEKICYNIYIRNKKGLICRMGKHIVKCKFCGESFDTNTTEFIKIKNRYAHKDCATQHEASMSQEEKDLEALYDYVKKLLADDYNYIKIKKQIEKIKKNNPNYTYSGMKKSLQWFYELKQHSVKEANGGIGIVPYIYNDACKYFYSLYLAQMANKDISTSPMAVKEFNIESPRFKERPIRLWNIDDDD